MANASPDGFRTSPSAGAGASTQPTARSSTSRTPPRAMGESRVVLLDVDGTLVDYQARLPASAADAVRAARAAGHRLYLCTGRAKAEVYDDLWALGVDGLIGGNGSYVEAGGQVLLHRVLGAAAVTRAVDRLLGEAREFYLECNHALYGTDGLPEAVAALFEGGATEANVLKVREGFPHLVYGGIAGAGPEAAWRTDCNKISFVLGPDVDLERLAADFAGHAKVDTWSLTGAGPEFGEIGQVGVHKGTAVAVLAGHLGVPTSAMIAFGDARSDLELLTTVGTGVAMGQAPDELKAVAALVTDPVDADGLAHAFEQLGLMG